MSAAAALPIDEETASMRAAATAAVDALNKRVATLYPLGTKLTVLHPGNWMLGTVIRHAKDHHHAGELLVEGKHGGRQWIQIDRIVAVEWTAP